MDDSKIYLSLAVNRDGQLVPCDQNGREVYRVVSLEHQGSAGCVSQINIEAHLHDFGTDNISVGYVRSGVIETMQQRALIESEVLSMNNHLIERFERNLADMKRKAEL